MEKGHALPVAREMNDLASRLADSGSLVGARYSPHLHPLITDRILFIGSLFAMIETFLSGLRKL
jgi:hypothetical protein